MTDSNRRKPQQPSRKRESDSSSDTNSPKSPSKRAAHAEETSVTGESETTTEDLMIVEPVGVHWLRARWLISPAMLSRANSVMGRDAYRRQRVLRIFHIEQDEGGPRSKELTLEIPISDQVEEWCFQIPRRDGSWSAEVGYLFGKERFFSLGHSTPITLDESVDIWHRKPVLLSASQPVAKPLGGAPPALQAQGTLVVNGSTEPLAEVLIDDEKVSVDRKSGRFSWQSPVSHGRTVYPIVVSSGGRFQRALLAIDINLHLLDPEPDLDD